MHFHIIIPTYNRKDLLPRAIDSVLSQKIDNNMSFDVYVVDDGSTDGTRNMISQHYIQDNIHYFYKENGWVWSARNVALDVISKNWKPEDTIVFLDDDDALFPNAFAVIHSKLLEYPDISYFYFWVEYEDKIKRSYISENNKILTYEDTISWKYKIWDALRVIRLAIFTKQKYRFFEEINWWEFLFWYEINKDFDLLITTDLVLKIYLSEISLLRSTLTPKSVDNKRNIAKLMIDSYWDDLYRLNKKWLGVHYLVYARMPALSDKRLSSVKPALKWLSYSFDISRFWLRMISLLPWWVWINNFLIKFLDQ